MDEFKRANDNRAPTQVDIQSMINRLLLPAVIKETTERSIWNPLKTPWSSTSTSQRDGFLFESRMRSDGSTVDVVVNYTDIPIELRNGIAMDLERELGRKPSEAEVIQRYEDFALGHDPTPIPEPQPYDYENALPNRLLRPLTYLPGKGLSWLGDELEKFRRDHEKNGASGAGPK
jgi:hypothetical protein